MEGIPGVQIDTNDELAPEKVEMVASSEQRSQRQPESLQITQAYRVAVDRGLTHVVSKEELRSDAGLSCILRCQVSADRDLSSKADLLRRVRAPVSPLASIRRNPNSTLQGP
jgi:hypothetical protein